MAMKSISTQQGTTLIEVVITVLILATSLLAMANLQTRSLQFNQGALMRSQANIHVYDILDRMRLNRGIDADNRLLAYSTDYDGTPSGNAVATTDVAEWRERIQKDLPDGKGKIACDQATRICTITIKWSDSSLFDEKDPEVTNEFEFTSVI